MNTEHINKAQETIESSQRKSFNSRDFNLKPNWDPDERFELRCELDAAFFHLYEINYEDASYILDNFSITRDNDIKIYQTYRTKDRILEIYNQLEEAKNTINNN